MEGEEKIIELVLESIKKHRKSFTFDPGHFKFVVTQEPHQIRTRLFKLFKINAKVYSSPFLTQNNNEKLRFLKVAKILRKGPTQPILESLQDTRTRVAENIVTHNERILSRYVIFSHLTPSQEVT